MTEDDEHTTTNVRWDTNAYAYVSKKGDYDSGKPSSDASEGPLIPVPRCCCCHIEA